MTAASVQNTHRADSAPLTPKQRQAVFQGHVKDALVEHFRYDSRVVCHAGAIASWLGGHACRMVGRDGACFKALAGIFNGNLAPWLDRNIIRSCRKSLQSGTWIKHATERYMAEYKSEPATQMFFEEPERLLGTRALVLKANRGKERGALLLDYNFVFPTMAHLFDMDRIAQKYHLVMLPSWTGLMVRDVLSFTAIKHPIACLAYEQKDYDFLSGIESNLHPVRATTNFFCDHRTFHPQPHIEKDLDVISVAAWGHYKRYPQLLRAIARLKKIRPGVKVAMVGYPSNLTLDDIKLQAKYYGILDSLEFHEFVSPKEVNNLYARSRVNILWSRREGSGRTPVEGMMAGVPCVLRKGFNYGEHYDYMNEKTGRYSTEADLPQTLNRMIDTYDSYDPRAWILNNITPQITTQRITKVLKGFAEQSGEPWTEDPVVTCGYLTSQEYWNPEDRSRFIADYDFLKSCRRGQA